MVLALLAAGERTKGARRRAATKREEARAMLREGRRARRCCGECGQQRRRGL